MQKISFILLLFFLIQDGYSQSKAQTDYISKYADYAITEMKRSGVPAAITLAQGIIESGSGKGTLSIESNNHFGIKCKKNYEGKVYFHSDDEDDDCFRVYESVLLSYEDHSNFLLANSRYDFLFEYKLKDYKSWAKGLKKAGYATDPKYAKLIIKIIEQNNLNLITTKGKAEWFAFLNKTKEVKQEEKVVIAVEQEDKKTSDTPLIDAIREKQNKVETPLLDKIKDAEIYSKKYTLKNGATYILTKEGDTFETIKERHNIWITELRKYNEIIESPTYKKGEKVFIRPKKNTAKHGFYTVLKGDNLYKIAQKFGVKQKKILKRNGFKSNKDITEGMRINLK